MAEGKKEERSAEEAGAEAEEPKAGPEELKDRLLRLAAEFDNYKKRSAKEVESAKTVGKAELAAKLLPILDEFQLAIENLDMNTEKGKGMAIVLSNFGDVLKKEGLQEIECRGVYDPYRHEIMMTKESDEKEGVILNVVRKGYLWDEIMLRPASVIVSKGSREEEETE